MDSRDPWDENHHQTHHHLRENIFGSLFPGILHANSKRKVEAFSVEEVLLEFCGMYWHFQRCLPKKYPAGHFSKMIQF